MRVQVYTSLPAQARRLREAIFIKEQGFQNEFDDIDKHCWHLLAFADRRPQQGEAALATCRFFPSDKTGKPLDPLPAHQCRRVDYYTVGRIAVDKAYRNQHIGAQVLKAAEAEISRQGGLNILLHAQEQAEGFYRKQGYQASGPRDEDEGCPHVWMSKTLIAEEKTQEPS